MRQSHPLLCRVSAALLLVLAAFGPASADDCEQLIDSFNTAIDSGRESSAQELVDQIATDSNCGKFQTAVQRRLAAFRLAAAQRLMAREQPSGDYRRLLTEADR